MRLAVFFATSIVSLVAASVHADASFVTYDVNLTFDAGNTPFMANGVTGLISGPGTILGTFTVDNSTNTIETVSIVEMTGTTLIANYILGPGYSGLSFGFNGGYSLAGFSEPGYETPNFDALFFYPAGSQVYTGDAVFGSATQFFNGQGQEIAQFQLSGTILQDGGSVPEPASIALSGIGMLMGVGGWWLRRRKLASA